MATSTWNTFANSTTASAVDVNANFDAVEGDIVPMSSSGTFTNNTFNIGTSTAIWATGYFDKLVVSTSVEDGTTAGITASTTQTQGQQALTDDFNEISTVANDNDTVTLKTAIAGAVQIVLNNGANILQIFPASGKNLGKGANTAMKIATGTTVVFKSYDSTNYQMIQKFSEIEHSIHVNIGAGHGSTNTKIRRIETSVWNRGTAITVTNSSTDGTSFTIKEDGIYAMTYSDQRSTSTFNIGISVNSSQLTTLLTDITDSDRIAFSDGRDAVFELCAATVYLSEGDIVRPHTSGTPDSTIDLCYFIITKIS